MSIGDTWEKLTMFSVRPDPTDAELTELAEQVGPLKRILWELGPHFYLYYRALDKFFAEFGPSDEREFHLGDIYKKLRSGDAVSDAELAFAIEHFTWAENVLTELGDEFHHARCALTHDLVMMRGWKASRERKEATIQ